MTVHTCEEDTGPLAERHWFVNIKGMTIYLVKFLEGLGGGLRPNFKPVS